MKIRLHKPKRGLWNVALLLFVLGVVAQSLPIVVPFAFYLILLSAALLLLGTWAF